MREQIQTRLEQLNTDFAAGQTRLQELEAQLADLRATLLQINGARLVLEQLLEQNKPEAAAESPLPEKPKTSSRSA